MHTHTAPHICGYLRLICLLPLPTLLITLVVARDYFAPDGCWWFWWLLVEFCRWQRVPHHHTQHARALPATTAATTLPYRFGSLVPVSGLVLVWLDYPHRLQLDPYTHHLHRVCCSHTHRARYVGRFDSYHTPHTPYTPHFTLPHHALVSPFPTTTCRVGSVSLSFCTPRLHRCRAAVRWLVDFGIAPTPAFYTTHTAIAFCALITVWWLVRRHPPAPRRWCGSTPVVPLPLLFPTGYYHHRPLVALRWFTPPPPRFVRCFPFCARSALFTIHAVDWWILPPPVYA